MNPYNSENQNDGEWDDRGEVAWSEGDWNRYLTHCKIELSNFLKLYESSSRESGHLDEIARQMGWDVSDWYNKEGFAEDELTEFLPSLEDTEEDFENCEPYTLHRHPVYIVSKGLFLWLRNSFESFLKDSCQQISAQATWNYASVLQNAEHQAIMGTQALDMADYSLAICHFKRALAAINLCMSTLVEILPQKNSASDNAKYRDETNARLFDLREVYLRIIGECRCFENGDFPDPF